MATMTENVVLNEGISAGLSLQVKKVIRASRERVFEAWTKPEVMERWFGPANRVAARARTDLRVGGEFRIEMLAVAAAGQEGPEETPRVAVAEGVYREIVPNERLSFTWRGNWEPAEESLVTVSLREVEGGTEVTILHERFATDASMRGHEQGWTSSLEKLAALFTS